jgi:hypothetical protein
LNVYTRDRKRDHSVKKLKTKTILKQKNVFLIKKSDLNKKCDESEKNSGANSDQRVGPHRQDVFLETNQVNENRSEDETRQEHDRLQRKKF